MCVREREKGRERMRGEQGESENWNSVRWKEQCEMNEGERVRENAGVIVGGGEGEGW